MADPEIDESHDYDLEIALIEAAAGIRTPVPNPGNGWVACSMSHRAIFDPDQKERRYLIGVAPLGWILRSCDAVKDGRPHGNAARCTVVSTIGPTLDALLTLLREPSERRKHRLPDLPREE